MEKFGKISLAVGTLVPSLSQAMTNSDVSQISASGVVIGLSVAAIALSSASIYLTAKNLSALDKMQNGTNRDIEPEVKKTNWSGKLQSFLSKRAESENGINFVSNKLR